MPAAAHAIVLDTDIGTNVDDALALALALHAPELELVAVTTVGREAKLRARIAAKLIQLAGRTAPPVAAGCRVPLQLGSGFRWFGHESEGILEPTEEPRIRSEHAVDLLRAQLHARDDLEIVALGPLTNLAAVLILEPELAGRIRGLTIMGGHLRNPERGPKLPRGADYNLCADPHAAFVVLRSGIPTRLVPIEVTLSTWLGPPELARIEACATPLHRALADLIRIWTPIQRRMRRTRGLALDANDLASLHDALALACVYEPTLCELEELWIETHIEPPDLFHTRESVGCDAGGFRMQAAVSVHSERFRAHLLERITGGRPA